MDLTYFNPNSQQEADFILSFVARQRTLDYFLKQIRTMLSSNRMKHFLVVAPRGFGKTSLLRRIAIAVQKEHDLRTHFVALRFREEQHNVISLDVFWRNCLQSLAEAREDEGATTDEIEDLDAAWFANPPRQALSQIDQDGEPARQALMLHCERMKRRPLLLIDNLDTLLAGLTESHQWSLRKSLQSDDGPVLLAAASRYPAATHDHNAAFYQFFRVQPLEKLDDAEVFVCLRNLALHRGEKGRQVVKLLDKDPGRVAALNTLAGGNPRTLSVLYGVLESHMSADVLSQLSAMLDTFTGWYQARTEELPMQARAVFDALALNWDPMTAAALGLATGLDTPAVSSQLARLEKAGYAETVALTKRGKGRKGYQVSERFFNIWYLMRNGPRRAKQSIRFLTTFLQSCFSSAERRSLAVSILESGRSDPGYTLALASCLKAGRLRQRLLDDAYARSNESGLAAEYGPLIDGLRHESPDQENAVWLPTIPDDLHLQVRVLDEQISRLTQMSDPSAQEALARAMVNKGVVFTRLDLPNMAISAWEDVAKRFASAGEPVLMEAVTRALSNTGVVLAASGRMEEADHVFDGLAKRFTVATQPEILDQIARALFHKAFRYESDSKPNAELGVYDEIINRFNATNSPLLHRHIARALFSKGVTLGQLGEVEAEIAEYDKLIDTFRANADAEVQEYLANSMINKAVALDKLGKSEDEIRVLDDIVLIFGENKTAEIQESVARALYSKALTLGQLKFLDQEIDIYNEIKSRFLHDPSEDLRSFAGRAMLNKAITLEMLDRVDEGLETYNEIISSFEKQSATEIRALVCKALLNRGVTFAKRGDATQASRDINRVIEDFGDESDGEIRAHVVIAFVAKALTLIVNEDVSGAIAIYENILQTYGETSDIRIQSNLARVHLMRAQAVGQTGTLEDEILLYDKMLEMYGDSTENAIQEQVAAALISRAFTFDILGQHDRAKLAYEELIKRYDDNPGAHVIEPLLQALYHKAVIAKKEGESALEMKLYDRVIALRMLESGASLGRIVADSFLNKATALRERGMYQESEEVIQELIRFQPNTGKFFVSLGNLRLDYLGKRDAAIDAYLDGLQRTNQPNDYAILHANIAYASCLFADDRESALFHANKAMEDGTSISPAGRHLLTALPIWGGTEQARWENLFKSVGAAIDAGDPALWSDYSDDLQRLLWYVLHSGKAADFKAWMTRAGFAERFSPLYHAFTGAMEGEDYLFSINPETRQPALEIHRDLLRRLEMSI